ncbi:MAG: hypothetical protein Q6361_01775 [Candidatus Hermodarchaeota archaeon]|nr:hypothetical protein [Candidatus Hermodarchaeota archaeon]
MMVSRISPNGDEQSLGTFRIISVKQRHERSGREVMLIDGESMGETKTDLRKRLFTYKITGITDVEIKSGTWLMSSREDLGAILDVEVIGPWGQKQRKTKRVALRVRFDEISQIRLNEEWTIFPSHPITGRMRRKWLKRMNENAEQYLSQILPGVLDSVLFEPSNGISGTQINQIRRLETLILSRAIQLAIAQEKVYLTSNHLVQATKEILANTVQSES